MNVREERGERGLKEEKRNGREREIEREREREKCAKKRVGKGFE